MYIWIIKYLLHINRFSMLIPRWQVQSNRVELAFFWSITARPTYPPTPTSRIIVKYGPSYVGDVNEDRFQKENGIFNKGSGPTQPTPLIRNIYALRNLR